MLCSTCGTEILPSFKHALARNECPSCGGLIMDEESLALIEDVSKTILELAAVREETAHTIATAIVTKYDLSGGNESVSVKSATHRNMKVAPPSSMKRAMQNDSSEVVSPEIPEGISDKERERIMEDVVRKKYNMVDQLQAELGDVFESGSDEDMPIADSVFTEGAANPVLERERLARLAKQRNAMNGGGDSSFRRSG